LSVVLCWRIMVVVVVVVDGMQQQLTHHVCNGALLAAKTSEVLGAKSKSNCVRLLCLQMVIRVVTN
jgi:hypothetical protein